MESTIRIMIVDDHMIFRQGLSRVIDKLKNVKVVAEASNGKEFLELLKTIACDIVFMDIEMPQINGIEATKAALKLYPEIKIIALSMFGEEEYLQQMIDAGAAGFLLKNISREGLERAIRAVFEGNNYYSEELLTFFTKKFINSGKHEDELKLTRREVEVLQLIAIGLNDQEIGDKLFISQRTVNGHRSNLISKTGSRNTVNLLVYAIKNKLVEI